MTSDTDGRRASYVLRQDIEDFQQRLADVLVTLGELTQDLTEYRDDGLKFPLDISRWVAATLRDIGNREQDLYVTLAGATDHWVPGTRWERDYTSLMGTAGLAGALLCPHRTAVLSLDISQAASLDDVLDTAALNLSRYRKLVALRQSQIAALGLDADEMVATVAEREPIEDERP